MLLALEVGVCHQIKKYWIVRMFSNHALPSFLFELAGNK
jgi:hypothetical protein